LHIYSALIVGIKDCKSSIFFWPGAISNLLLRSTAIQFPAAFECTNEVILVASSGPIPPLKK
jgi:hypothetical protein